MRLLTPFFSENKPFSEDASGQTWDFLWMRVTAAERCYLEKTKAKERESDVPRGQATGLAGVLVLPWTRRGGGGSVQRAGDLRVLGLQLWEQLQVLGLQHLGDERQLWLRIASDGRGSSLSALATKFRAMWGAWPWLRWELASFFFEHPKSPIACSNLGQIWIVGEWSLGVPYLTLWRVSGFRFPVG